MTTCLVVLVPGRKLRRVIFMQARRVFAALALSGFQALLHAGFQRLALQPQLAPLVQGATPGGVQLAVHGGERVRHVPVLGRALLLQSPLQATQLIPLSLEQRRDGLRAPDGLQGPCSGFSI